MKTEIVNNDKFIIYLNKLYYTFDRSSIESCLYKILKRLKKIYNVEVYSTFNVECYINDNYGVILVIEREYDPFNLYSKKTDLNVKFYDNSLFLYEIDDYFIRNKFNNIDTYIYNNKIYVDLKDNNVISIIEHAKNILFGDMVLKVISGGNQIK